MPPPLLAHAPPTCAAPFLLTYVTLVWMAAEAAASLCLGARSHSLLLDGFGLDSMIKLASASVLALALVAFLIKEGREAVTGECTCGSDIDAH